MPRSQLTSEDYERALELWPTELMKRVRNVAIVPNWIDNEDRFWFRHESAAGHTFMVVDATTGEQRPAFDHQIVARAIGASANALPISHLRWTDGGSAMLVTTPDATWRIDLHTGTAAPATPTDGTALVGPDGRALFIRDCNLWLRDPSGEERALTHDGEPFHAWGSTPDMDLMKVARNRADVPMQPTGCYWSPRADKLFCQCTDERHLEPYPYLESVPFDGSPRPRLHFVRQQLVGETAETTRRWCVIDTVTGARTPVAGLPGRLRFDPAANGAAWWNPDGSRIHALAASSNSDHVALVEIDAATGSLRILHEERVTTFFDFNTYEYNLPNVRLLHARGEALWYSQADGWGHLYTIDLASGRIRRQLTAGAWAVFDVIAVTGDTVFFTAGGREPGRNPYYRHLYRVDLDGSEPNTGLALLTPEDADHGFPGEPTPLIARALRRPTGLSQMAPSARYFVDCVSRGDLPPRYELRDASGQLIAEIARADISALEAVGWQPPERFVAKAADGETDLYGVLLKPRRFDPSKQYAVIERIYAGPQIPVQPRSFLENLNGAFMYAAHALAELDFVVVLVDGPGTPYRSKAFHDHNWDLPDRWGLRHHRAAIEGAARSRPWMDLERVGLVGHSYGGYATAMGLLLEPDFFKVGVSSAGMYDPMWAHQNVPERHLGRPTFGGDRHVKNTPDEVAENYLKFSPSYYAERLVGRLLLVYGDLDENIQPAGLLKFTDALIKAGKHFDELCLPGRNHGFTVETYFQKQVWDYFVAHLQDREPLIHHRLGVAAGTRMMI